MRIGILLAAVFATALVPAGAGAQQDAAGPGPIPGDIRQADSALTDGQQSEIDAYVGGWLEALTSGEASRIARGRARLRSPLEPGASAIFYSAYSTALSNRLPRALEAEDELVRVNAMIVAARLRTAGAFRLIVTGLSDASPGVRYWAAKTVTRLQERVERSVFDDAQRDRLLRELGEVLEEETAQPVVEKVMLALVGLDLKRGAERVLDGMEARVEWHARNAGTEMTADRAGLRRLFRRMLDAQVGEGVPKALARRLTFVAHQYLLLTSRILDEGIADPSRNPTYPRMVQLSDSVMRWAAGQLGADVPDAIDAAIRNGDWAVVRLLAEDDWKAILQAPPFELNRMELTIPQVSRGS